nr:MAG TPA: hypothetical protein [Caudoviricetes sp.]
MSSYICVNLFILLDVHEIVAIAYIFVFVFCFV